MVNWGLIHASKTKMNNVFAEEGLSDHFLCFSNPINSLKLLSPFEINFQNRREKA